MESNKIHTIEIGGRKYKLKASLKFIEIYYNLTFEDISELITDLENQNLPISKLVNIFKAGLLNYDETIDLNKLENTMELADFIKPEVITKIFTFFMEAMGIDAKEIENVTRKVGDTTAKKKQPK